MYYLWGMSNIKKQVKMENLMNTLSAKLQAKTITVGEKKLLFSLAFGDEYMDSNDKGKKKKYNV